MALCVVGCASHSLVPGEQAAAIKRREQTLAPHANAIQEAIRRSDSQGALAFLDGPDGHLVVLPGNSPVDAWARRASSAPGDRLNLPAVLTFVYRGDLAKAPESVTRISLDEQLERRQASEGQSQALRTSLSALGTEVQDEQRRSAAKLDTVTSQITDMERRVADALEAARQDTDRKIATTREDLEKSLNALADDLAEARKFMLRTAQLGWLNHELNVENANGVRRASAASQELAATAARLADTMRQLSESLSSQLRQLADQLDSIQKQVSNVK
jgi:G:T/U-mismatch repair DNA glycosylase